MYWHQRKGSKKVFQPFSQFETPYDKKYEGTGLGFTLLKRLIELHKGKIWCESTFGKGSGFCFVIPIEQKAQVGGIWLFGYLSVRTTKRIES